MALAAIAVAVLIVCAVVLWRRFPRGPDAAASRRSPCSASGWRRRRWGESGLSI